jgi:pyrroloquinoline quinone biosynthesis protein D
MSEEHTDKEFCINSNYRLQYEEAQGCYVLLYPEGLVKLSDTAVEILRRCEEPISCDELIRRLQRDYPDADTLEDDVRDFWTHAISEEWVVAN